MESKIKLESESNNVVFNLDNNTQLEFLNSHKTIVVIDKPRFLILKSFLLDSAPDSDYANFLNIPIEKVRYFKHKMQQFEDSYRARRRAARLAAKRKRNNAKPIVRKREISSEERFKKARELISKNYSTNQISKILKISERSVTRFKKRIREEKKRLRAEGKIQITSDDPDDESSFKYLTINEKIERAKELFQQQLKIQEISEILKISERSVRRWQTRLNKMEMEPEQIEMKKAYVDEEEDEDELLECVKQKRKRRTYLDKDKVQYAKELIENGLSNKEMSLLLEMSIACVRKLKAKIQDGTVDELIDDSEEHYKRIGTTTSKSGTYTDEGNDPLNFIQDTRTVTVTSKCGFERKPKVALSDRDMLIVRLLRDNGVRTMDIAKLMSISERSVTRLLSKSRERPVTEYQSDIVEEVERLLAAKDDILNEIIEEDDSNQVNEDTKENIGMSLISMNTKVKDIMKMLDVPETTVQRWKLKMIKEEKVENEDIISETIEEARDEYIIEYLD